jgi:S-adenosylmethionine:tRNA ribosyltransferase-isomerase
MHSQRQFQLSDFYFYLPENLIAHHPESRRDHSRLFISFPDKKPEHTLFYSITDYIHEGDVLVINDARVIPGRLFFKRSSGSIIEIVLSKRLSGRRWLAISTRMSRLKPGESLECINDNTVHLSIIRRENDFWEMESDIDLERDVLEKIGRIPLPPYIKREPADIDAIQYQTVYAKTGIAAAAPTAGLHFTNELLSTLQSRGVIIAPVTLEVSYGTFQPVRYENLDRHVMHSEYYHICEETADAVNRVMAVKGNIICVGTTSLRALESAYREGKIHAGGGDTSIFIYPPRKIETANSLITNFHTPNSTLLMLVTAFGGYERIMEAYRTAITMEYRFFSYGDAMLIIK